MCSVGECSQRPTHTEEMLVSSHFFPKDVSETQIIYMGI